MNHVIILFDIALAVLLIGIAGAVLYLITLLIAAARVRVRVPPDHPYKHMFRIVVPAHNEEHVLRPVLRHIAALQYPAERWDVVVVADNCTDATATIALEAGARVLQRNDPNARGKGHALAFAFDTLRSERYDALFVLDADTLVEPDLLEIMNRYLHAGHRVLQTYHDVLNPNETRRTQLMNIALHIFHYVRPLARRSLHLSTGLNGNGMCFAKAVIDQHPWNAFSLVEDMEYTTTLIRHGEHVVFAPEAIIKAQAATGQTQATSQRLRWEGGRFQLAWRTAPTVIAEGIRNRDLNLVSWGIDMLVPPLAIIVLTLLVGLVSATVRHIIMPSPFTTGMLGAWLSLTAFFLLFILGAMAVGHLPRRAYVALLSAPAYVLWKLGIYGTLVVRRSPKQWTRTERRQIDG